MASLLHKEERIKNYGEGETEADLSIASYTAITADEGMRKNVLEEAKKLGIENKGEIVIGNWEFDNVKAINSVSGAGDCRVQDEELCKGEMYHTILADYLVVSESNHDIVAL